MLGFYSEVHPIQFNNSFMTYAQCSCMFIFVESIQYCGITLDCDIIPWKNVFPECPAAEQHCRR